MIYPTISEYVEAIKSAEDNFEQLNRLRPVLGEDGEPVMSSGNFAVVFKMKDEHTGKLHAVKCFLKEQEGRADAYHQIAEELEYVSSTFLTPIKYLDKELFVDSANSEDSEFPVLLMDWVEGQTLDKYIREHIDDQYELSLLAYQFSRLAMWLMPQPFAHGDLKPDNILVKEDGTLVLVDYDGMYVPAMKGQKARELGSPDFRHPGRTENDFDEHIDDFSLASILLSLKAIALQPSLLEEYGASDRLLFSEKDYRNLSESSALGAMQPLMQDAELASLYSLFILALSQNNLSQVSFRLFNLSRPDKSQYEDENLSTEVTKEDWENAWKDEYGGIYSVDKKRLLRAPSSIGSYHIIDGTLAICDNAFCICPSLHKLFIPISVKVIGDFSFSGCSILKQITCKSKWFKFCNGALYSNDFKRLIFCVEKGDCFKIPNSVTQIAAGAFMFCRNLIQIDIPDSVERIGIRAFEDCKSLKQVSLPDTIREIDFWTFRGCKSLSSIDVPDSVIQIGEGAFMDCISLTHISIPECLISICDRAFENCKSLIQIIVPQSVTTIGRGAFNYCRSIKSMTIPEHVSRIDGNPFEGCVLIEGLECKTSRFTIINGALYSQDQSCLVSYVENGLSFAVPNTVTTIGDGAFGGCKSIKEINMPNTLMVIGNDAFRGCTSLDCINIPQSVTEIGDSAFKDCESLSIIKLPSSVMRIGNYTFCGCISLTEIFLPNSIETIGSLAFGKRIDTTSSITERLYAIGCKWCDNLSSIIVPFGYKNYFEALLPDYKDKLVEQYDEENLSTEVTDEDLANAWTDECGVKYSSNRKRLLTTPAIIKNYSIKNGTIVICNNAFSQCRELQSVQIPNSVTAIGDFAFYNCVKLNSAIIPKCVKYMGVCVFEGCERLQHYHPFE